MAAIWIGDGTAANTADGNHYRHGGENYTTLSMTADGQAG